MKYPRKLISLALGIIASTLCADSAQSYKAENQWTADLGNGFYKNPVLIGGWGDPTAVKVGEDYYMAYSPGNQIMFWHSRDLVNWKPIARHSLGPEFETIWAIDMVYFDGKFHVYMPIGEYPGKTEAEKNHRYFKSVWVITAEHPTGEWSSPIRVDRHYNPDPFYTGIDPGFIQTPEGKKYLYVDNGFMMPLSDDGLSSTAMATVVYEGWDYPDDWVVQCKCLESPKLFYKDGYYYIVSAMGGTSGPATAHMGTVARATSPVGPWEESPFNPLVHTYSEDEPWWHQGHPTILEGPEGNWYTLYPARPAWYTGMGKQTILMPLEWTEDGWPLVANGFKPWEILPKPKGGENSGHGMTLSDDFEGELGIQWNVPDPYIDLLKSGRGKLVMTASGDDSESATQIVVNATNHSFEATVEVKIEGDVTAGLVFGNHEGLRTNGKTISYNSDEDWRIRDSDIEVESRDRIFLKIRNYRQNLSFYGSLDGENWTHFQNGVRSGDYRIRLFAAGEGKAVFKNFRYLGLESMFSE